MNALINFGLAVFISFIIIMVAPKLFVDLLKEKDKQEKSFFKFIISREFLFYIFVLPFGPLFLHALLDKGLLFVLRLFNIKYKEFMNTVIGADIATFYFFLFFIIAVIVSSLHYNTGA